MVVGITVVMAMFFLAVIRPVMIAVAILLWRAAVVTLVVGGIGWWATGRGRRHPTTRTPVVRPPPQGWLTFLGGIALGYVLQGSSVLFLEGWWGTATLLIGLLVLGAGLVFGLGSSGSPSLEVTTPYRSWRAHWRGALAMWLALAAFAGGMQIVTGINEVLGLQSTAALFADLSIVPGLWLAFGFLLGVAFPESWTASLASIQLAIRTRFRTPLRLMAFAEDAREREVLRTVGPIYQFRHRHLQELLTAQSSPKVSALRLRTARNALRSVAAKLQRGGSVAAFRWAGPVQPALAVGAVTAATYWLGQGFVYPDLWGTRIGAATTLVAGFGAGLGAVMSQSEVDGTDARWAFLFRPGLVFGLGTVLAFNLAANIGRSFLTTFWLQDATKGLPFAVALWLVLGLGAAAIRTRGGQQLLKVWHKVHENLPLVFVVGLGVGWIGEGHVVAVIPGTEMTVHGEVVTAGARNGLISTIAAGSVALGFLLILAFAPLPARKADSDTASSIEKPGRLTRLLLWAVAGSLLANILTRDVIRAFYLSGSESMAGAWLVTLVLTLLPGYVLGLVFPRIQPPDTAGAAPQPGNANPEPG